MGQNRKYLATIVLASCVFNLELPEAISQTSSPPPTLTPAPPPSSPAKRSAAELEKLAMPIALHPDPLVSIILPASVYPVEIVMAARFVKDTNNIPKVDAQTWDENVKAVAKFPELIAKMDADLDWTAALGVAFLEQRKELMDTIQALRLKAQQAGTLQTTPQQIVIVTNSIVQTTVEQQVVVVTNTVVQIQPSNPEVIYVPSYPPTVYYPPPVYPYGYPYYAYGYYPYAPLMTFSAGFFWGAAFSHWNHCDWHGGDIDIDRNINIDRGDRTINRGDRVNPLGDRAGNRGGGQRWQADQGRLQRAGAPTAKTREARGWAGGSRPSQRPSTGAGGGARPSQQPSLGGGSGVTRPSQQPGGGAAGNRPQTQPSRSASASQRPSSTPQRSYASPSANRATPQRSNSGAFSGVGSGGGNTRNYSNRGSYSRGGGGFSGGGGGGRGGGRGGGGRR